MAAKPVHFPEWLRGGHVDAWLLLDAMRRHVEAGGEWTRMEHARSLLSSLMEECLALEHHRPDEEIIHLLDASLHSLPIAETNLTAIRRFLQRERRRVLSLLRQDDPGGPGP